jgi:hypothetical protein
MSIIGSSGRRPRNDGPVPIGPGSSGANAAGDGSSSAGVCSGATSSNCSSCTAPPNEAVSPSVHRGCDIFGHQAAYCGKMRRRYRHGSGREPHNARNDPHREVGSERLVCAVSSAEVSRSIPTAMHQSQQNLLAHRWRRTRRTPPPHPACDLPPARRSRGSLEFL